MNIFDSTDNLLKNLAGLFFSHFLFVDDIVKKLSILHKFHDKEKMFGGLYDLIELNYVGMANEF